MLPFTVSDDQCKSHYKINYHGRAAEARKLRKDQGGYAHAVKAAGTDTFKIGAMFIDCQGTFCYPDGELYVGGQSGDGAVQDSRRIAEWVLRNLPFITQINCTMDTHTVFQVFHEAFFICGRPYKDAITGVEYSEGDHPAPMTSIQVDQIHDGTWGINPEVAYAITGKGGTMMAIQKQLEHYVTELKRQGKYALMVWPYHAMIGSANHALVTAIEEAVFFHGIARGSQPNFEIKGGNPLTENYSVLRPEVLTRPDGGAIATKNSKFIEALLSYDALFIAGQAKSHCVAWTIDDLLTEITARGAGDLAKKVWLLEDCTSPVAVPDGKGGFIVDFTTQANEAFDRFKNAGMNVVNSTVPVQDFLPVGK